jgi:hypothetical protein
LGSGHVEHHDEDREQDHGSEHAGEERGRALVSGTHGENVTEVGETLSVMLRRSIMSIEKTRLSLEKALKPSLTASKRYEF